MADEEAPKFATAALMRFTPQNRLRRAANKGSSLAGVQSIVGALSSQSLARVIAVLKKSPAGRSSDDVKYVVKWLMKRRDTLKFFAHKPPELLEQLARYMHCITYAPGKTVFRQGDIGDRLYIIVEGRVGVFLKQQAEAGGANRKPQRGSQRRIRATAKEDESGGRGTPAAAPAHSAALGGQRDGGPDAADMAGAQPALVDRVRRSSEALLAAKVEIIEKRGGDASHVTDEPAAAGSLERSLIARRRWKMVGMGLVTGVRMARLAAAGRNENLTEVLDIGVGGLFGELALQDPRPRRRAATIKAKERSLLFTLDKDTFLRIGGGEGGALLRQPSGNLAQYHAFLSKLPLFAGLDDEAITRLTYGVHEWKAPRGTVVARANEKLSSLSIVSRGSCSITMPSPVAGQQPLVLGVVGPGECLGEKCVLLDQANDFTVVTNTETEFLTLPDTEFKRHRHLTERVIFETVLAKQEWHRERMHIVSEHRLRGAERRFQPLHPPHAARPIGRRMDPVDAARDHQPKHVYRTLERLTDDDFVSTTPRATGRPSTAAASPSRGLRGGRARAPRLGTSAQKDTTVGEAAAAPGPGSGLARVEQSRSSTAPAGARRRPAAGSVAADRSLQPTAAALSTSAIGQQGPVDDLVRRDVVQSVLPTRGGEQPPRLAWSKDARLRAAALSTGGPAVDSSGSSGEEDAAYDGRNSVRSRGSNSSAVRSSEFIAAMQEATDTGGSPEKTLFGDEAVQSVPRPSSPQGTSRRPRTSGTNSRGSAQGGRKRPQRSGRLAARKERSWDQIIASEQRIERQSELQRIDKLIGRSRNLVSGRPTMYDWESEVQSLQGDARYDRITAQPLRRKAVKKFVGGRKR